MVNMFDKALSTVLIRAVTVFFSDKADFLLSKKKDCWVIKCYKI